MRSSFRGLCSYGCFLFAVAISSGSEGLVDAEMVRSGYRVSDIAPVSGRADPGRPGSHTVALMSGHWAIAVFPVFDNCSISVSYKTSFRQSEIPADDGRGYAVITVDATQGPSYGSDVRLTVTDKTQEIGCPYHIKVYRES
jgi:hypothetical protein